MTDISPLLDTGLAPAAVRLAWRNDAFRHRLGRAAGLHGATDLVALDEDLAAQDPHLCAAAIRAVAAETRFPIETDPFGTRERGVVTVQGVRVEWRIAARDRAGRPTTCDEDAVSCVLSLRLAQPPQRPDGASP